MKKTFFLLCLIILSALAIKAQTYCTPFSNCGAGDRIDSLIINNIMLSSGATCGMNGYSEQSSALILSKGVMNTLKIRLQSSTYNEGIAVWIDYNKDGDFEDTNEKLFQTPILVQGSNGPINTSFTIPSTISAGIYRLRIRVKYDVNTILPCESYTYGETEDYLLNIGTVNSLLDDIIVEQTTITQDTTIYGNRSVTSRNNAIVNSNQKAVSFIAGQKVVLEPGTEIKKGSSFVALIGVNQEEKVEEEKGLLTFKDSLEYKFASLTSRLTFRLYDAVFSKDSTAYSVEINKSIKPLKNFIITDSTLSFSINLNEGLNKLFFYGYSADNSLLQGEYDIWAGNRTLSITVIDENNNVVPGAEVSIELADDKSVRAEGITSNVGMINFPYITQRTIIATAKTNNEFGTLSIAVSSLASTSATIKLKPFGTPSKIDNNDFSQQTAGWNIGTAPVTIIPHAEGLNVNNTNAATNYDLQLSTLGEGPQFISRTFNIKAGIKQVTLKYRFITSEVPGGYFGSRFNDYFAITVRSQGTGGILNIQNANGVGGINSEQNSMNGLGLSAFDANGATNWREVNLPVSVDGDVVQVEVTVANVADGLFNSQVVVDLVEEKAGKFSIEKAKLQEKRPYTYNGKSYPIFDNPIQFISLDQHTYFKGQTQVMGSIKLKGNKGDKIASLKLELYQGSSTPIATGVLKNDKLKQPFGDSETIEISANNPEILFEIPGNITTNETVVQVRIVGETESGEKFHPLELGTLKVLKRYKSSNRYGSIDRDGDLGGDDWAAQSVITNLLGSSIIQSWSVGDISNMNGGYFPPHRKGGTHEHGLGVDMEFGEFATKPNPTIIKKKETAEKLLSLLSTSINTTLDKIIVTYDPASAFWKAIKDTTLPNGVIARNKIKFDNGHADHFHLSFYESAIADPASFVVQKEKTREDLGAKTLSLVQLPVAIQIPNPILNENSNLSIVLEAKAQEEVIIQFQDIKGNIAGEIFRGVLQKGENNLLLSSEKVPNLGEYLINVKTGSGESHATFTRM